MDFESTTDIKVNDTFDDLSDENQTQKNELMFANNCLKVFNEFKLIFELLVHLPLLKLHLLMKIGLKRSVLTQRIQY